MSLPAPLSVEDLFAAPLRVAASLSPDGTRIAYLAPWENRLNVWIESVDTPGDARCVTAETRGVQAHYWTDDPRWLLYTSDQSGDENFHLHRVDLDVPGAEAVDLTPVEGAKLVALDQPAWLPGKAIIQINMRDPAEFDLVEVDVATGELTTLIENFHSGYGSWLYGPGGELYIVEATENGDLELLHKDSVDGTLRTLTTFDGADYVLGVWPLEITPDGKGAWAGSNRNRDLTRVVHIDFATGEETEVDSHPAYELDPRGRVWAQFSSPLIRRRRTGELIGVRYLGERQVIRTLDPHFAEVLARLETLSDGDVSALSSDESEQRWIVSFTHDRDPATYFYDHATGESRLLFRSRENLDPRDLAPMTPVTVTSRDGLSLPCQLTLPVGIEPTGLPLLLFVHGGPWTRDSWGFHAVAQLFANRGYAVLQVNFRGSTGYGKAFTQAAVGEFAGTMHDDLVDGVRWAVEQGYADPDRVAVMGGSYGGYSALVGASFTPDVFAAAVDVVGVSNLVTFLRGQPEQAKANLAYNWYRYVGDPSDPRQEAEMLARSPISRVDQIRKPLMVVQGAQDARVAQAESDQLVDALRERGTPVEYILMEDEGHLFDNQDNAVALYRAAERFLNEHLGVDPRST